MGAPSIGDVRTAVVHFARLATCLSRKDEDAEDDLAMRALHVVVPALLDHARSRRDEDERAASVYLAQQVASAYRKATKGKLSPSALRAELEAVFLHAGPPLTAGQLDAITIDPREISRLGGPIQAAHTTIGKLYQVERRQMFNRAASTMPHPFDFVAFDASPGDAATLGFFLACLGLDEEERRTVLDSLATVMLGRDPDRVGLAAPAEPLAKERTPPIT